MAVYFLVEGRELKVKRETISQTGYFNALLKDQVYSEARITVPDWMSYRHLEIYLSYLSSNNLPKLDIKSYQKVLWIADYFEEFKLQEIIIPEIVKQLTRDSVLYIIQDAAVKISSGKYSEVWKYLYESCKSIVIKNLAYILSQHSDIFDKLEPKVASDLIEDLVKLKYSTSTDNAYLIESLKTRQIEYISNLILSNQDTSSVSFESIKFLVSLNNLNVKDEDSVLDIICKWCENNPSKPNENDFKVLLDCIKWPYISLKSLINSIYTYPSLKHYYCYRKIFKDKLYTKSQGAQGFEKPRDGYKNRVVIEDFKNPQDYVESLADVLLGVEMPFEQKFTDESAFELNSSVNKQVQEINKLKNKYSSISGSHDFDISPMPDLTETTELFDKVPQKTRGNSLNLRLNNSLKLNRKTNKTGILLSSIIKRLNINK
jgi:DNA-directed RNA polymerase subunit F